MSPDPRRLLFDEAASHHGVVAVADARRLGLTTSQVRTDVARGLWRRPCRGVLVSTAAPRSWHQVLTVATTSTGGLASHRSAARLHGLDGQRSDVIEVSVLRPTRRRRDGWAVHQCAALDAADRVVIDGIPTTGLARTLVDLGAVADDDQVEQALDDAYRRGASPRWVLETLDRLERSGPSGTGSLRRVLERDDRRGPLPDSMFERLVERAGTRAGLPAPVRQFLVHDEVGRLVAVIDHAWPDRMIGCEAQSERWHGGPRGAQRDLDRHNRLTAAGWNMLYATWGDARSPAGFVARLRELHRISAHRG
jgi:hypothetical protein